MTLFEVGVVIATVVLLAAILLPASFRLRQAHPLALKIFCTNNLKQIGLAFRIWGTDHDDIYPTGVSVAKGGSMEMVVTGNVLQTFVAMSNELSTPRILQCPACINGMPVTDFSLLSSSNLSYFVGVDVTNDTSPTALQSGDCNFEIGGKAAKSGLLCLSTNDPLAWHPPRHGTDGNLLLGDGSVQNVTSHSLSAFSVQTGVATNRLAIP